MPAKNSLKKYVQGGFYHIYNRGVEKRPIFLDQQDYGVFLSYLKNYLSPKNIDLMQKQLSDPTMGWRERDLIIKSLKLNNFYKKVRLLTYCLMPNHFHLIVNQTDANTIDQFINSLNTRYVMYFNKKYKRVGPLFQGVYKAVLIESNEQLLYLSIYIHTNPLKLNFSNKSKNDYLQKMTHQPSSLLDYLGISNTSWVDTKAILSFFSERYSKQLYESFLIEQIIPHPSILNLTIDNN